MVVDASAVIALIQGEPQAVEIATLLVEDREPTISAPTATECAIVLSHRHGVVGRTVFERVRQEFHIGVVSFTEEHVAAAHRAYIEFGKGRHPAALNFGDCMTYATARLAGAPLLAVGNDFPQTDLEFDGLIGYWQRGDTTSDGQ
jgi:ribonuclease VapC